MSAQVLVFPRPGTRRANRVAAIITLLAGVEDKLDALIAALLTGRITDVEFRAMLVELQSLR